MSGESTYLPKSAIAKWFDDRLPVMRFLHDGLLAAPTPRNLNYLWTFGAILTFVLISQILTGVALVMHYTPDASMAFDSVDKIMRDVNFGYVLRNWHAVGASMFFAGVYVHVFRGMYYGSYAAPRELVWIIGVFILFLLMAIAFMGYVLPWGQMSFWGATVITNFFTAIPFVGEALSQWLLGGFAVGDSTLKTFFSLHYLLPFVLVGLVGMHIWAVHVTGSNNPTGVEVVSEQEILAFHPYFTIKDVFAVCVFMIVFVWFAFFNPFILGHADNYIPANNLVTPTHIVPEWYFLPFYAILRAIPDKLGGVIAMAGSIAILAFLPWLDTSSVRSGRYRPLFKLFFTMFVVVCVLLGWLGGQPADGDIAGIPLATLALVLTVYYFGHFIVVMPLLGWLEKTNVVPLSVAKSLEQGGA